MVLASETDPLRLVRSVANLVNARFALLESLRLTRRSKRGTMIRAGYWMNMSVLSRPDVEERKVARLVGVRRGEVEGKRRCLMSEDEGFLDAGFS